MVTHQGSCQIFPQSFLVFWGHLEGSEGGMSLCWGDAWTNTIQPFWALPALGIAKLGARDIMGYMVLVLIWQFIVIVASILLWTYVFL